MNADIIVVFTENGLIFDTEAGNNKHFYINEKLLSDFKTEPYKTLLNFGFESSSEQMSQSLLFLHEIAAFFTEKLSKNPDIEITRSAGELAAITANVKWSCYIFLSQFSRFCLIFSF